MENKKKRKQYPSKKEYHKKNLKYQTVCFKIEEMEEINEYCKSNNIPKNAFLRKAAMEYIGKYTD